MVRIAVAGLLALTLAACAKPRPQGPPVHVEPSQLESMVFWASDLADRQVSVDGYIGFDNGPSGQGAATGPDLMTTPDGHGDGLIRFEAEQGKGPNQMDLPVLERRTMPSIPAAPAFLVIDMTHAAWQDAGGKAHPFSEKVRVTGRLTYLRVGAAGLWSDEDASSPTGRRFKPRLTDVTFEPIP